jgi:hypothetical protein
MKFKFLIFIFHIKEKKKKLLKGKSCISFNNRIRLEPKAQKSVQGGGVPHFIPSIISDPCKQPKLFSISWSA